MHIDSPHRYHIPYTRMAKDTATGDVVLEYCDPPKGKKIQRQGQGWSGHTVDHHANGHRLCRRIGKYDGLQRLTLRMQLVVVANRQNITGSIDQEEIVVCSIG